MGTNPSDFKSELLGYRSENNPVEQVSWFDAIKFANALSRKEGLPACYDDEGTVIGGRTVYACKGYSCQRKPSGSTRPVGVLQARVMVNWTTSPGTMKTAEVRPIQSARRSPMPLGSTICWATCGSGAMTGIATTSQARRPTPGIERVRTVSFVVGRGSTTRAGPHRGRFASTRRTRTQRRFPPREDAPSGATSLNPGPKLPDSSSKSVGRFCIRECGPRLSSFLLDSILYRLTSNCLIRAVMLLQRRASNVAERCFKLATEAPPQRNVRSIGSMKLDLIVKALARRGTAWAPLLFSPRGWLSIRTTIRQQQFTSRASLLGSDALFSSCLCRFVFCHSPMR